MFLLCYCGTVNAEFDPWPAIKHGLFQSREIVQDQNFISLYVPKKVEDAAMVPVKIRLSPNSIAKARQLYLIIDRNPDPYAMQIEFMPAYNNFEIGERLISTRVRLNEFSRVRAILEMDDGGLFMSDIFASGAGGCSAPPATDLQQALKNLGEIRLKSRRNIDIHRHWNEATIMVRHPNFTGMQAIASNNNEIIPANFINKIEVMHNEETLLLIHSGITISENPVFRFSFGLDSEQVMSVKISDSNDNVFEKEALISHVNQ